MGHKQAGGDVLGQKLLQPEDGVDIQVVGGLVQQQNVGVADQGPGQQHPPLGAAGEGLEQRLAIQIQPVQHPLHLLFMLPLLSSDCRMGMLGHHLEDRPDNPRGDILGDQRHPQALTADQLAPLGWQFTGYQFQEGGFTGAVPAQQAEPVSRFDLQGDAVKQGRAAKGQGDITQG